MVDDRTAELQRVFGVDNIRKYTLPLKYEAGDQIFAVYSPDMPLTVSAVASCSCDDRSYYVGNGRWICGSELV